MVLADIKLLYTLSGFVAGIIVGFTGIGGGSLMTPVLVALFGVYPSTAISRRAFLRQRGRFFWGGFDAGQLEVDSERGSGLKKKAAAGAAAFTVMCGRLRISLAIQHVLHR
jgi:hypothetical protein